MAPLLEGSLAEPSVTVEAGGSETDSVQQRVTRVISDGMPASLESASELSCGSDDDTSVELRGVAAVRPPKLKKLSWDGCLCCNADTSRTGGVLLPFREKSWQSLHTAADVRRDATYVYLLQNDTILPDGSLSEPKEVYHKACYSSYTSRRNLAFVAKQPTHGQPCSWMRSTDEDHELQGSSSSCSLEQPKNIRRKDVRRRCKRMP